MQMQLIRNATMRITYAGRLFIADPFLAPKDALEPFGGKARNPLVDLPMTPQAVIAGIEMILLSHLHSDHFDDIAKQLLPKELPVFCQPGDEDRIREAGFRQVTPVTDSLEWHGVTITRTPGQHGTGEILQRLGSVCGFILRAAGEPTVYWAGDTIWYPPVEQVLVDAQPDIIVTHSSGAKFGDGDPIVMDAAQTLAVCKAAPAATVVAIHLESLDHGTVSRPDLRARAQAEGVSEQQLRIPADGATLTF